MPSSAISAASAIAAASHSSIGRLAVKTRVLSRDFRSHLEKEGKSFSVDVLAWKDESDLRVSIPRHLSHADQGSDLNVTYMALVKKLGLVLRDLEEIDPALYGYSQWRRCST